MVGRCLSSVVCAILVLCATAFAQYELLSQRSLLEKKIYYIADGKIGVADYWSLPLGKFDCTLRRYFPGEDTVPIQASVNFALLSSGYIEGSGYGTRGKTGAEGQFIIQSGDTARVLDITDIDYVYLSGGMVKPLTGEAAPLILRAEQDANRFTVRRMQILIWRFDTTFKELKHVKVRTARSGHSRLRRNSSARTNPCCLRDG
jgi:hypothetical protein